MFALVLQPSYSSVGPRPHCPPLPLTNLKYMPSHFATPGYRTKLFYCSHALSCETEQHKVVLLVQRSNDASP